MRACLSDKSALLFRISLDSPSAAEELLSSCAAVSAAQGVLRLRLSATPSRVSRHREASLSGDAPASSPAAPPPVFSATPGSSSRLARAFSAHLRRNASLESLELCFALPPTPLRELSAALPLARSLRSLSLAGSRLGDARLQRLLSGLALSPHVESLDVRCCALTPHGGAALARLLREHAHQLDFRAWRDTLRQYRRVCPALDRERSECRLPAGECEAVLGLVHLDASHNALGTHSVLSLCEALEPTQHLTRLRSLVLRGCGLGLSAGDWLADVMRRGAALGLADCRDNEAGLAVVLRDAAGEVCHLTATPAELRRADERAARMAEAGETHRQERPAAAVRQPPMRTGLAPQAAALAARLRQAQGAAQRQRLRSLRNADSPGASIDAASAPRAVPRPRAQPPSPSLRQQLFSQRPGTAPASQQMRAEGGGRRKPFSQPAAVQSLSEQLLRALTRLEVVLEARSAGARRGHGGAWAAADRPQTARPQSARPRLAVWDEEAAEAEEADSAALLASLVARQEALEGGARPQSQSDEDAGSGLESEGEGDERRSTRELVDLVTTQLAASIEKLDAAAEEACEREGA